MNEPDRRFLLNMRLEVSELTYIVIFLGCVMEMRMNLPFNLIEVIFSIVVFVFILWSYKSSKNKILDEFYSYPRSDDVR